MKQSIWLLLILIASCSSPTIKSTNLTDIDIPEYVDHKVVELMPEVTSITYMSTLSLPRAGESVSVCYEALVAGDEEIRYYGLASLVEGKWFVTFPSMERVAECPVYEGA